MLARVWRTVTVLIWNLAHHHLALSHTRSQRCVLYIKDAHSPDHNQMPALQFPVQWFELLRALWSDATSGRPFHIAAPLIVLFTNPIRIRIDLAIIVRVAITQTSLAAVVQGIVYSRGMGCLVWLRATALCWVAGHGMLEDGRGYGGGGVKLRNGILLGHPARGRISCLPCGIFHSLHHCPATDLNEPLCGRSQRPESSLESIRRLRQNTTW